MNIETSYVVFILKGEAMVSIEYSPSILYNHDNSTFNFTVRDSYGNPVSAFSYSIDFGGVYSTSGTSSSYELSWETETEFLPSSQWLNITLSSTYLYGKQYNFSLTIMGTSSVLILKPTTGAIVDQGEDVNFTITLQDALANYISDAVVTVQLGGSSYTLSLISSGTYSTNISTTG